MNIRSLLRALIMSTVLCSAGIDAAIALEILNPTPVIVNPTGVTLEYKVKVTSNGNPVNGAYVRIEFPPEMCDLLVLCNRYYQDCPLSITQITTPDGYATFDIRGSGCWDETVCSLHLARIYAKPNLSTPEEMLAKVGVRSPDVVGAAGNKSCDLWCEAPFGGPGLSTTSVGDAVFFTYPIATNTYVPCADVNGDQASGLADAILVSHALRYGATCSELDNP
jgi:hypothetical protein